MLLMAVLIAGYIGAILIHAFPKINNKVTSLEKINIQEKLNKIVAIGKLGYEHLEEYETLAIQVHTEKLKGAVLHPLSILKSYGNKASLPQKKEAFSKIVSKSPMQEMHFFIASSSKELLAYADNQFDKATFTKSLSQQKLSNKSTVFSYKYSSEKSKILHEDIVYLEYFAPWDIYVGAQKNIDSVFYKKNCKEAKLLARLYDTMNAPSQVSIGQSFVFNEDGEILFSQNNFLEDANLKKLTLPKIDETLFEAFTKAAKDGGTLEYNWYSKNKKTTHEKILWIDYVPDLQWYVATSLHEYELEIMSNKLQRIIATLGVLVFLVALIISFVFFKKLLLPISTLSHMANSATKGDYSVRSTINSNDEIGELSKNFNSMIETIERNIEKEKQIMEQSRLAQMGEMMSMIAHQWRQPLGAIASAVMNMKIKLQSRKDKLDDKETRETLLLTFDKKLTSIEEYAQFLSTTVDDFRTFFKKNTQKELVPISEPVEKALHMIEASLKSKNIKVSKYYLTDDSLHVYMNELVQVLLNILKNSEDNFIEKKTVEAKIVITTKKEANVYHIIISDNGGGVPKSLLSKLCEPYFSTKHEKNGTGLGLYMSRVIIEDHHRGKLLVSNVKNGISFKIVLPK